MKTTRYLFPVMLFLSLCGCQSDNSTYTVSGIVSDSSLNGKTIYITLYGTFQKIDSTQVNNSHYTFTGKADSARLCYILVPGKGGGGFILENGDIRLHPEHRYRPSGTPMNDELTRINMELDSLDRLFEQKKRSLNNLNLPEEELEKEWDPFLLIHQENLHKRYKEICRLHPNDALGHYALIAYMDRTESPVKEEIYAQFGASIRATRIYQRDKKKLDNEKKANAGKRFMDLKGKTLDGKEVALSDYIGKGRPVLMDIWASWCKPCRKEIPALRQLYRNYHQKGLDIIGVFIKDTPENLQAAMQEEQICWPQIIDRKGDILELYGTLQIPQIILFDAEGTIVKRNLRDRKLIGTIKEFMQKEN